MKKLYSLLLAFLITNVVQAQSIQELRDSIEAGNLNSQVDLALRYMMGDSLEQNEEEAIRLIRDAADSSGWAFVMSQALAWSRTCRKHYAGFNSQPTRVIRWPSAVWDKHITWVKE